MESHETTDPGPSETLRRYVSLQEAARYAGVSTMTIRRFIESGELVAYKIGPRLVKLDLRAVDALFVPQTAGSAQ